MGADATRRLRLYVVPALDMVTSLPKPVKGAAAKMQRARRRLVETRERAAKAAAKARDYAKCRRCRMWQGRDAEAAHLVNKGMGGDHGRHSSHQRAFVTLCADCHRGPRSLHSGHVRAEYGPDMGDGPVYFMTVKRPSVEAKT